MRTLIDNGWRYTPRSYYTHKIHSMINYTTGDYGKITYFGTWLELLKNDF